MQYFLQYKNKDLRGAIYEVIIDLGSDPENYNQLISMELTAGNRKMRYTPKDFAHGFLTLEDETEVFYQMSECYMPEYARGVGWNDPVFNIKWKIDVKVISERDKKIKISLRM